MSILDIAAVAVCEAAGVCVGMGFGDGRESMGIEATSAGAAAANGGLALASVSTLLGTAVPFSPFGLVAERSSIQAVNGGLVVDASPSVARARTAKAPAERPLSLPPFSTRLCQ